MADLEVSCLRRVATYELRLLLFKTLKLIYFLGNGGQPLLIEGRTGDRRASRFLACPLKRLPEAPDTA